VSGKISSFLFSNNVLLKKITRKKVPTRRKSSSGKGTKKSPGRSPTAWDQAARWYDALVGDHGSDYQKDIIMPGAYKLMNLKKGDRVLDLACGQGVFSRYLFAKGIKVDGLDTSEELIRLAGTRSKPAIRFHLADARKADAFKEGSFDAVACLLALQNMEDIEPVFNNAAKWLKPEGRFVMVVTHPCFRIPRQTHWGWDEEKKIEFRRVDRYASDLSIPIITPPLAGSSGFTTTYHRSLQNYFAALAGAGLGVESLEEWASKKESQPGKRAKAENRARKEIPLFLSLCARPILANN
jgi:ubiquinone/menaquinone biosynthesis C-methylase UbiE